MREAWGEQEGVRSLPMLHYFTWNTGAATAKDGARSRSLS